MAGVSFIIPVHNGAPWLRAVLDAIAAEVQGRAAEVIVIDDASTDESRAIVESLAQERPLRLIDGGGRGAAAALNVGLRAARFPIVCQVDQDVVIDPEWLTRVLEPLGDPSVAAAQGHYRAAPGASILATISALDLADRYAAIPGSATDHVCTGNAAYRVSAIESVGGFDEAFGYGYDNDMSYRLQRAGYRLAFAREATSVHYWRTGLAGYCRQQYGQGYGRLQLVARHPDRVTGDAVSRLPMMLHPFVMTATLGCFGAATALALSGASAGGLAWRSIAGVGLGLLALLAAERLVAGGRSARRSHTFAPLLFPVVHLLRDVVWVGAVATWSWRWLTRRSPRPAHSMRGRPARSAAGTNIPVNAGAPPSKPVASAGVLVLIPAHNESAALPQVVADVREHCPEATVLVIDDGSVDETSDVAESLGVNWIQLPVRMGIGSAMRAGLRYARRRHAAVVVRLDGDGQHRAAEIAALVAPIREGRADVVLGSRYVAPGAGRDGVVRLVQRALGWCLSALTGQRVTDPTSGFCAFSRSAAALLCDRHPTGYPEPELRLLLSRHRMRVVEIPMQTRSRLAGRTSLTLFRLIGAAARVLLAMVIVPLRHASEGLDGD